MTHAQYQKAGEVKSKIAYATIGANTICSTFQVEPSQKGTIDEWLLLYADLIDEFKQKVQARRDEVLAHFQKEMEAI